MMPGDELLAQLQEADSAAARHREQGQSDTANYQQRQRVQAAVACELDHAPQNRRRRREE